MAFISGLQFGTTPAGSSSDGSGNGNGNGSSFFSSFPSTPPHYLKAVAIVKHSFAYDLEGNHGPAPRTAFDAVVSDVDRNGYFWPPFEAAVARARAGGLMCSYNGVNGVPSCMDGAVNNGVVRGQWGGNDTVIVSDCGAVGDTFATAYIKQRFGGLTPAAQLAAQVQQGLRGGCDFNCGDFYQAQLPAALEAGAVNDTDVDVAAARLLKKGFQLGLFDAADAVPWAAFGAERLASAESAALALEGAAQGIVLLQNDNVVVSSAGYGGGAAASGLASSASASALLPLAPGAKVALIGPHANATVDMLSNYHGDDNLVFAHSPLLAMARRGDVLGHAAGCGLSDPDESGFGAAAALAAAADVAVVFLGLHPQWFDDVPDADVNEGEDRDRANITLPRVQLRLLQAVVAASRTQAVVLVLVNGGQLAIPWAKAHVPAIVEAFYPGQMGGDAIAAVLYGDAPPSGRLPYTVYDDDFAARRPDIGDMSLSGSGGITYQYYGGAPLWPFGHGLSFTTWALSWAAGAAGAGRQQRTTQQALADELRRHGNAKPGTAFAVTVTNTGSVMASDVVVLAFLSADAVLIPGAPQPLRELFAFCRLRAVAPRASAQCELTVAASVVAHNATIFAGAYSVSVELGDGTSISGSLLVDA